MQEILQVTISGLATGAIYAMVAMGFTLLWQTTSTINFAQGEFVMLPAFLMLGGIVVLDLPLAVAFVGALLISAALLGAAFKRAIIDPMIRHGVLPLAIATIGLTLALKNGVKAIYGAEAHPFPHPFPVEIWRVLGVAFSSYDIAVIASVAAVVFALNRFLNGTMTGRSMQAVAQNPEAAVVLGIDVKRLILYTFVVNAALAAAAALLVTPVYLFKFDLGESLGLKAFYAAIIGGFNQMRGALVGGLIVGVLENLSAVYFAPAYKDAVALGLFVLVILFRPEGLLGREEARRV
ncbi:MAG: branched-chain amino acid ABC transporter permease [Alphaproteobacteria bacterium]|nr:branched-chain amino acid ABC transporter permease [Alphaproteobacteria bacterium]